MKLFLFVFLCSFMFAGIYKCERIKKNKNLRNLLNSLTERVETSDGNNEYTRLTQAPTVEMKLSKATYNTSLQDTLVSSYAEKVKEVIAKTNFEINKENIVLEELNDSLRKVNTMNLILLEHKDSKLLSSKERKKYFHYLDDTINEDLHYYPIYKTMKSNPVHFKGTLNASLTPSELLEKGEISHEQFVNNLQKKLVFPERGDKMIEI